MTSDDRPDIFATGALRPTDDRRAMLLARIKGAAAPALAARRGPRPIMPGVLRLLAWSALPAGAAAAASVMLAVGLLGGSTTVSPAVSAPAGVATDPVAVRMLADVDASSWIAEQAAPTDDELVEAIGLGGTVR